MTCIGKDPRCPCQDGDACHYKDCGGTKAWPVPKAEPVGEVTHVSDNGFQCEFNQRLAVGAKLYTTPPAAQRPWVGLTDEEIEAIGDKVANEQLVGPVANFRVRLARAIEQTLKEKNHD